MDPAEDREMRRLWRENKGTGTPFSRTPEYRRMEYHAKEGRGAGTEFPYICPECEAGRRTMETLRAHLGIAHGVVF